MRRRNRARLAAPLLGLAALLLAGCGLFKPTSPEAGEGGELLLANYSDPESCLTYMAIGIGRKDQIGLTAYVGAMADSPGVDVVGFHASFDDAVWIGYSGSIGRNDWGYDQEENLFYPAFTQLRTDKYVMDWGPDVEHPLDDELDGGNGWILHRHYRVRAISGTDSLIIAIGYADLTFRRISSSRWALTRWDDRVDSEVGANPTKPEYSLARTFGYWRLNATTGT